MCRRREWDIRGMAGRLNVCADSAVFVLPPGFFAKRNKERKVTKRASFAQKSLKRVLVSRLRLMSCWCSGPWFISKWQRQYRRQSRRLPFGLTWTTPLNHSLVRACDVTSPRKLSSTLSHRHYIFHPEVFLTYTTSTGFGTVWPVARRAILAWNGPATKLWSCFASINNDAFSGIGTPEAIATGWNANELYKNLLRFSAATLSRLKRRSLISSANILGKYTRYRTVATPPPVQMTYTSPSGSPSKPCNSYNLARVDTANGRR